MHTHTLPHFHVHVFTNSLLHDCCCLSFILIFLLLQNVLMMHLHNITFKHGVFFLQKKSERATALFTTLTARFLCFNVLFDFFLLFYFFFYYFFLCTAFFLLFLESSSSRRRRPSSVYDGVVLGKKVWRSDCRAWFVGLIRFDMHFSSSEPQVLFLHSYIHSRTHTHTRTQINAKNTKIK